MDRLLLIDPIVEGRAYLETVAAEDSGGPLARTERTVGIIGFPLDSDFGRELLGVDLRSLGE